MVACRGVNKGRLQNRRCYLVAVAMPQFDTTSEYKNIAGCCVLVVAVCF